MPKNSNKGKKERKKEEERKMNEWKNEHLFWLDVTSSKAYKFNLSSGWKERKITISSFKKQFSVDK